MALMNLKIESQCLSQNTEVSIILPDIPRTAEPKSYYESGKKYKVVWLLHGGFGDSTDWWRRSRIELYACERDVAVVMPSAYNSHYLNWPEYPKGMNVYDYITRELMTLIPAWFPVSTKREDNFIFGLSMGGGGAAQICTRNPDRFGGIAILAGGLPHIEDYANGVKSVRQIVDHEGGLDKFMVSEVNAWMMMKKNASAMPMMYYACGDRDHNYNRTFMRLQRYAKDIGLNAAFETYNGFGHEWRFWDQSVERALDFFGMRNVEAGNLF